jgi:hypothetical protein
VNAVWVEGNGHPKKGMLIGFASGFALGLGIGLASEGGAWVSPAAVGIGLGTFLGLIGIPVGAMVGAGSPSWEPIYPAPH